MVTARPRGSRCRVKKVTAGSSPMAMNRARAMRVSTWPASEMVRKATQATATPRAPVSPMKKGLRWLMGRPGRPRERASASCSFPSTSAWRRLGGSSERSSSA